MRFILDASVAVRWFLEEERHRNADVVLERLVDEPGRFAVPELFSYEVLAVLFRVHPDPLRAYVGGVIPLLQGGMLRYPMTESIAHRAFGFQQLGLSGYDACYAAVAEELEGLWLTFDTQAHEKLRRTALSLDIGAALPEGLRP